VLPRRSLRGDRGRDEVDLISEHEQLDDRDVASREGDGEKRAVGSRAANVDAAVRAQPPRGRGPGAHHRHVWLRLALDEPERLLPVGFELKVRRTLEELRRLFGAFDPLGAKRPVAFAGFSSDEIPDAGFGDESERIDDAIGCGTRAIPILQPDRSVTVGGRAQPLQDRSRLLGSAPAIVIE